MLQSVGNEHDDQFESGQANSIEALVAARNDGRKHLLLAASGSVATIKIPVIVAALAKYESTLSIRIVLTEPATHFLGGQSTEQPTVSSLLNLPNVDAVYRDRDEWGPRPWRRGARADLLVVAPLSANTLAKVVNGMSDNLLTSIIRAWDTDASIDMKKKIILVAPAMNSAMWRHPVTEKQIQVLTDDWGVKEEAVGAAGEARAIVGWFKVIAVSSAPPPPTLACGDTGGAMASVESICAAIEQNLNLVTTGELLE
ncbi:flavoprotein [Dichotomopilus funicola]|uniref:Flavoprotein n=1 Tax=Dichotomopilus funicola TaxID=1934379 RepID=A0AAN6VBS8_9PEZI|nr:flavoprotein [Dichotomopilus funicola]